MTTDPHAEFLQDPEAHASHLEECAQCRAILETLNASAAPRSVEIEQLPLAAWEGATYRSWPFVVASSAVLTIAAVVLCYVAGVTPANAIEQDASQWQTFILLTRTLTHASLGWRIVFGIAFIVVNSLLVLLLRRPPRGVDA